MDITISLEGQDEQRAWDLLAALNAEFTRHGEPTWSLHDYLEWWVRESLRTKARVLDSTPAHRQDTT